jgi:hypothetical protein
MNVKGNIKQVLIEECMKRFRFGFGKNQVIPVQIGLVGIAPLIDLRTIGIHLRNDGDVEAAEQIVVFGSGQLTDQQQGGLFARLFVAMLLGENQHLHFRGILAKVTGGERRCINIAFINALTDDRGFQKSRGFLCVGEKGGYLAVSGNLRIICRSGRCWGCLCGNDSGDGHDE